MFEKIREKLFPKKKEEVEIEKEVEELPVAEEAEKPLQVRVENLTGLDDVDRVARFVKGGDILFLKVKDLQRKDLGQFQNTLQKVKRLSLQFGWNLAALEEGYLILAPSEIRIER